MNRTNCSTSSPASSTWRGVKLKRFVILSMSPQRRQMFCSDPWISEERASLWWWWGGRGKYWERGEPHLARCQACQQTGLKSYIFYQFQTDSQLKHFLQIASNLANFGNPFGGPNLQNRAGIKSKENNAKKNEDSIWFGNWGRRQKEEAWHSPVFFLQCRNKAVMRCSTKTEPICQTGTVESPQFLVLKADLNQRRLMYYHVLDNSINL